MASVYVPPPRGQLKVGTLNCSSLRSGWRREMLVYIASLLEMDLVCVQEHDLHTSEEVANAEMGDGWLLMYSSATQKKGSGVGVLVSPRIRGLVESRAIHDRILRVDVRIPRSNVTVFCVYVAHAGRKDFRHQYFFNFLTRHVKESLQGNLTIVLGDFNAPLAELNFPPFELKRNNNSDHLKKFLKVTGMEPVQDILSEDKIRKISEAGKETRILPPTLELLLQFLQESRQEWQDSSKEKEDIGKQALFDKIQKIVSEHVQQLVTFEGPKRRVKAKTDDPYATTRFAQLDHILIGRSERGRIIKRHTEPASLSMSSEHKFVWCLIQVEKFWNPEASEDFSEFDEPVRQACVVSRLNVILKKKEFVQKVENLIFYQRLHEELQRGLFYYLQNRRWTHFSHGFCETKWESIEIHVRTEVREILQTLKKQPRGKDWKEFLKEEIGEQKKNVKTQKDACSKAYENLVQTSTDVEAPIGLPIRELNVYPPHVFNTAPLTIPEVQNAARKLQSGSPTSDEVQPAVFSTPRIAQRLSIFCDHLMNGRKAPLTWKWTSPSFQRSSTASNVFAAVLLCRLEPACDNLLQRKSQGVQVTATELKAVLKKHNVPLRLINGILSLYPEDGHIEWTSEQLSGETSEKDPLAAILSNMCLTGKEKGGSKETEGRQEEGAIQGGEIRGGAREEEEEEEEEEE